MHWIRILRQQDSIRRTKIKTTVEDMYVFYCGFIVLIITHSINLNVAYRSSVFKKVLLFISDMVQWKRWIMYWDVKHLRGLQMMITLEDIGNIIQLTAMVILVLYLLMQSRTVRVPYRSALYFMAGGYFCQVLGLVFWTLFQIIQNGMYPKYLSAYDVCSVGGFLFFISVFSK